eukprot:TRINITY_DN38269_c0_g1_i3.p1 TRINITY_DN38269_c0_g1~~TRINITY_DN38269_c0_g1_i3.p1  ORF type:complete len:283 (-),score=43.87 TRINITY_DN38269_c0_g1_i3:116-964(-)
MNRKATESNPPIQVVGFRVEGTISPSPSPAMKSVLSDSVDKEHSSGKPVIIPPSFKFSEEQEELARSTSDPLLDKNPVQRTLTAPPGTYANKLAENDTQKLVLPNKAALTSIKAAEQSNMVNGNNNEPTTPTIDIKKESGLPPPQKVNPIVEQQQPQQVNNSSQTSTSLSRDTDTHILDGQEPSASPRVGGGGVGETNQGQGQWQSDTPSTKKPTTRAERRALQEKQKAEKAARQEAPGKGGGQKSSQKAQESEKPLLVPGSDAPRKIKYYLMHRLRRSGQR